MITGDDTEYSEDIYEMLQSFNDDIIEENEILKKDITLANSKTANKVYLYERTVKQLSKGDVFELNDLKSTEMSIIEDRKTLFSMLKLLSLMEISSLLPFLLTLK